jgi:hypothetical protein
VLKRIEGGTFGTFVIDKVQLSPNEKIKTFEIDQKNIHFHELSGMLGFIFVSGQPTTFVTQK